jgi:hypothetical protein
VGFVSRVSGLAHGALGVSRAEKAIVVKIDGWFGAKWLGFSHKAMGVFGETMRDELAIPPFVPGRVVSEKTFIRKEARFVAVAGELALHINQPSEANARRKVGDSHHGVALFWWTGDTLRSGQGALMAYLPGSDGHVGWYAGLRRVEAWEWAEIRGIGAAELTDLERRGAAQPGVEPDGRSEPAG